MSGHITIPGGLLIVVEGPDGAGKSRQIRQLAQSLEAQGYLVVLTREPGGTRIGEQIRAVLHDMENIEMDALTELLLYFASRRQFVAEIIAPALAERAIVLSDRFWTSTVAYQGFGRGVPIETILSLTRLACGKFFRPDLVIHLDVDSETGLDRKWAAMRAGEPGAEITRLDAEKLDFHKKTRQGYLAMAEWGEEFFGQWVTIDATASIEIVRKQLLVVTLKALKRSLEGGGVQRNIEVG